jgi:hypothetical protein
MFGPTSECRADRDRTHHPALLNLPRPLVVGAFSVYGTNEQIFGADEQVVGWGQTRFRRSMSASTVIPDRLTFAIVISDEKTE